MASFDEYRAKLPGKYNIKKKEEEEEEKEEEVKSSSPKKSGSGTSYNDYRSKLAEKYLVSSMDADSASEWYESASSLISRLSKGSNEYSTYTNSADIEEVRSLLDSSNEFRKYLLSNRGKLEKYDDIFKGYGQLKSALDSVIKASNYYSQFKDEEDYNYQKQVADIYNMSATEVEKKLNKVSYYDSDYQLAFELSQTMMPYSKEYALQDGFTEEEWNDIDRKRKYLGEEYDFDLYADIYANTEILNKIMAKTEAIKNDASIAYTTKDGEKITWQNLYNQKKRTEKLGSLGEVTKNTDFETGSQFQSSKLADGDWWGNLTSRYGMGYSDLTHDYINGDDAFVGQVHTKHDLYNFSSNPANAAPDEYYKGYHLLKDDERAIYNYYYNTQGKEKAQEYLDALEETLQARLAAEYFDDFNDNIFEEYVFGAFAGFDQFASGFENLFSTEDYIPPSASQIASGMIREDLEDDGFKLPEWMGGASLGQVGYDAINTTANMLPSVLVGSIPVVGKYAGATLLAASAAGNAKAEMLRLGYSKGQADTYGLLVGASEGLLQYALGGISKLGGKVSGNVISKFISKIDNGLARTAIKIGDKVGSKGLGDAIHVATTSAIKVGGNMLAEGLEESLQSIIEPVLKSIVTGEELEAIDWGEVVYSGLLGMVTAGVLEGPSTIAGEVGTYKQGKALKGDLAALDRLTKLGSTMSADSVAFQLAGKVDANTGAYTIGRLLNEVGASLSEANKADIVKSLERKGMRTDDAQTIAKWLGRVVDGETFSNKQVAMIESNDVLAQTLVDVLINPNSTVWQRQGTYNELYELANAKVEKSKGAKTNASTTQASSTETKAVPVTENSTAKENATEGKNAVSESGKTTHNGVEVKISDIASIENGVVKLKLDSGEEVDMKEVEFATEEEGLLYETIIDKDIDTARDMVEAFKIAKNAPLATPQTLDTFIPGFNEAHTYGRLGIPQETLVRDGMFSKSLLEAQRKIAYNRGAINALSEVKAKQAEINEKKAEASENPKKAKPKKGNVSFEDGVTATTKNEKSAVKLAKVLSKAIGIDIVFYDARTTSDPHGKGANGYYDEATNTIHLDLQKAHNDTKTIAFSLSHEVTHFIKKWSPEKFDTLAKFLMEQYGEHGVDVATMLSNKMAELDTDEDTAFEEMVCDAMETMLLDSNAVVKLMKLRETDLTLFEKLKMHILELLNKLREAYRSLGYETTTDEAKALLEMTDVLEKFYALFEDAAVDATESFGAAGTLNTESVSVSEDGTVRLQMKQYQQTGRATLLNYLREQYGEQDANDLILTIDNIYDTLVEFKNDEALSVFGNWQDTEVELDENGHPIFTTSIKNGDYELNQDFSRVCKKRRQLDFVLNMLAEDPAFEASHLTKGDFVKINKAIKAHGFEIACALCFVDSKRFRQAEWADSFANTWNDILNAVVKDGSKLTPFNFATKNPNLADDGIEIDTSKAVTYRKWSDGREDVKNRRTYESFEQMLSKDDEGKWLEGNTNVRTIATLIRDNPELRHTFRGADIIASKGFDTIQRLAPGIRSILDGWGGSSVPKPSSNDTSYDNSIINMSGYNKKTAYAMGGVRMNSFSDFMAHMFFDYCQAFADLSAKELPSQAYTKELTYVRFFGRSGQKINMSGIAAIRDDALPTTAGKGVTKAEAEANEKIEKMVAGLDVSRLLEHLNKDIHQLTEADVEQFLDMCDYVWADESINMKHATLLQTGILYDKLSESKVEECYELLKAGEIEQALKVAGEENVDREYAKNCGTIVVGVSDAHIRKLLRDPTVRMVIPYHKSGLNPVIARELRISAYNDYTLAQTTGVKRKGSKTSDKIGSKAIKDAYGLKDFEFYDWFGKTIDGKLYDGKATADKYLEWCEKGYYDEKVGDYVYYTTKGDGYILAKDFHKKATIVPKFDAFMGEENYYKVLEDFDCYDTITGEHSAQGAVDFLRNGLPSDYKDVLSTALKEEQKVSDDFRDHLDNKGLKKEVMDIVKARGYEPSIKKQLKQSETVEQKISSAKTSIAQIPALFKHKDVVFGKTNIDIGGGKFDLATNFLAEKGTKNYVFDPYNRSEEVNSATLAFLQKGNKADTATCANVLNVIAEEEARANVILEVAKAIKADGTAYFMVYEGDSLGVGRETSAGWQNNRKTADYVEEISKYFESVTRKGKLIVAKEPVENLPKATWEVTPGKGIKFQKKRDSSSYAPTFYSQMGKVIDDIKMDKIGASSLVNYLKGKGIKHDEIKWSGIEAFLEGKKSVTKAELQEFVAGSQLTIEEEMSGYNQEVYDELDALWKQHMGVSLSETFSDDFDLPLTADNMADVFDDAERDGYDVPTYEVQHQMLTLAREAGNEGRWARYKLAGGKNYRELVFKMPNSSYSNNAMQVHWGEDAEGVLAHARIQDMTTKDGKNMLFVEEIQSDWHNDGAKRGYIDDSKRLTVDNTELRHEVGWYALYHNGEDLHQAISERHLAQRFVNGISDKEIHQGLVEEYNKRVVENNRGVARVPDAPFRTTYHEYVLKRLLRMAAEEGYDSLGWTTADIQSERWSSDYAEGYRIEYDQDIPKFLRKYGKKWGATVATDYVNPVNNKDNLVAEYERDIADYKRQLDEILAVVGETGRDTIADEQIGFLTEGIEDLQAGMEKLNGTKVWSMDITEPMAQSVLYEGQPKFQKKKLSNRTILANALESSIDTSTQEGQRELKLLKDYQGKIDLIEKEEAHLAEVNAEIHDISFTKGSDRSKLNKLNADKQMTANRIHTFDRQLTRLEAMKPIKDVLAREKELVRKRTEEKGREALAKQREKEAEKTRILLERGRVARKEAVKKTRESRDKREATEKLQKLVLDTIRWLKNPSKTEVKCPDLLKPAYAEFLDGIDLSSKRLLKGGDPTIKDLKLASAMDSLATAVEKIKNAQDPNTTTDTVLDSGYLDLPEDFVKKLREMAETIKKLMVSGDVVINQMTSTEVKQISKLIRTLNHAIKEMSTLYANLRFANVEELGDNTMTFTDSMGEAKDTNAVADFVGWDNALPYYAFKRFGVGGESIFEGLMDAQDKLARLATVIFEFKEKTWTDKEAKAWGEDTHTINLPSGGSLTLTSADAMGIYCLSRREQGLQHLLGGGTRVIGLKKGSKKASDSRSTLTQEDIVSIATSLTERQREVANAIQEFMSTVCAEWGNEISMKRFLSKEFTEKFYYPIESNDENLDTKDPKAQQSDLYRLLNISATKALTPGANNEVIIRNIFEVFTNHASDMARLNSFGMPLLDYMKWLNYRVKTVNEENGQITVRGVRKSMTAAYGDKAVSYIINLVKDVNGRHNDNGDNSFLMSMMRMSKTASVGNNLRVAFLQFTSYPRASMVLSTGSLAKGLSKVPQIEKAKKYCGIALWKSFGFYDTNIARSIEDQIKGATNIRQKIIELTMKTPEWADAITWGALWNACEYEVAKTTKNKVGSEEFYQEVGTKLREVVYATQVVDSILTRSQIMRSKSGLTQTATAYMSEPTLTANILMDAGFQFQREKRVSGSAKTAWKKTGKIVGGAVANYCTLQLLTSLAESLADAWRDDDDDEFYEKFLRAFGENLVTNIIPFNKIPIISDIADLILSRFGIGFVSSDNLATSWITQTADALDTWAEVLGEEFGGAETSKTIYNAIYKTAKALSSMTGISVSGAMREVVTLWNNTAGEYDVTLKIKSYEATNAELGQELYEAIVEGDDRQASSLESQFDDKKAIASALRKALRENDPRIKEAAEALYEGNISEYSRIIEEFADEGNFDIAIVKSAIEAELNDMDDDSADEGEEKDKIESAYETEHYYLAIVNGDTATAKKVKEDLIKTAIANGKSKDEAEASITSSFKTNCRKGYINGDITYGKAMDLLVKYGGADSDDAYWELKKWDYIKANGSDEGYSKYNSFYEAVKTGKNLKAVISEYTSHGVSNETLARQITTYYKPLYIEMSNSERAGIKGYLLNAYALLGYNRTDKSKDIDKWLSDN